MPDLSYVGPAPSQPNHLTEQQYVARVIATDIDYLGVDAAAAALARERSQAAAYFSDTLLPRFLRRDEWTTEISTYHKLSDIGVPGGLAPIAEGTGVFPEMATNMPMVRWGGPFAPEVINYSSAPNIATMPGGVANLYTLCDFTIPALKSGLPSIALVFGNFEGYATDAEKLGRPEVLVVANNKTIAWGAAPNGNGTGQMWPIVVMPCADTLTSPSAATTGPIRITAYLSASFADRGVGMGGVRSLVAYRVPLPSA